MIKLDIYITETEEKIGQLIFNSKNELKSFLELNVNTEIISNEVGYYNFSHSINEGKITWHALETKD